MVTGRSRLRSGRRLNRKSSRQWMRTKMAPSVSRRWWISSESRQDRLRTSKFQMLVLVLRSSIHESGWCLQLSGGDCLRAMVSFVEGGNHEATDLYCNAGGAAVGLPLACCEKCEARESNANAVASFVSIRHF